MAANGKLREADEEMQAVINYAVIAGLIWFAVASVNGTRVK